MSRILIGSSNVYRHYRASAYKKYPECAMIRCVDFESFSAQLVGLDSCETEVIISVLENFLVKAVGAAKGEEREKAIKAAIKSLRRRDRRGGEGKCGNKIRSDRPNPEAEARLVR
jgi:hypothetical protein